MDKKPIRIIDIDIIEFSILVNESETLDQAKQRLLDALSSLDPFRFGYGRINVLSYDSETGKLIDKTEI